MDKQTWALFLGPSPNPPLLSQGRVMTKHGYPHSSQNSSGLWDHGIFLEQNHNLWMVGYPHQGELGQSKLANIHLGPNWPRTLFTCQCYNCRSSFKYSEFKNSWWKQDSAQEPQQCQNYFYSIVLVLTVDQVYVIFISLRFIHSKQNASRVGKPFYWPAVSAPVGGIRFLQDCLTEGDHRVQLPPG